MVGNFNQNFYQQDTQQQYNKGFEGGVLLYTFAESILMLIKSIKPIIVHTYTGEISDGELLFFRFQVRRSAAAGSNGAQSHQKNRNKTHLAGSYERMENWIHRCYQSPCP